MSISIALDRGKPVAAKLLKTLGILCLAVTATAIVSAAEDEQISSNSVNFTTLLNFTGPDGGNPTGPLVQGFDGDLYGTTSNAGTGCPPYGCGTFFKLSPSGTMTVLYNFCPDETEPCATNGGDPTGGLTLGFDGNFYGETSYGGAGRDGTLFKITPTGTLTTLHSWCSLPNCTDGYPYFSQLQGPPFQASDGNLYGSTSGGGSGCPPYGCGTIFKLTPRGELTTLYNFCVQIVQGNCPDGSYPSGLIQGTDGNFYGTTNYGGAIGAGTVFKVTPQGELTTIYSFCSQGGTTCTDGGLPFGSLIQASNGNFYGTTQYRGNGAACAPYGNCGTVFEITPGGAFTTVYDFCSLADCEDGSFAGGPLIQGTDGNLYGETNFGGANGDGTLFQLTPAGVLTTLHSFDTPFDGFVGDGVFQATNGDFYGMTYNGGITDSSLCYGTGGTCGTVFRFSMGLGPFVKTQPLFGNPLSLVEILGTDLQGVTTVRFDDVPALFIPISKTLIFAIVPPGAGTGFVTVTTSSGTLKSNLPFQVKCDFDSSRLTSER